MYYERIYLEGGPQPAYGRAGALALLQPVDVVVPNKPLLGWGGWATDHF